MTRLSEELLLVEFLMISIILKYLMEAQETTTSLEEMIVLISTLSEESVKTVSLFRVMNYIDMVSPTSGVTWNTTMSSPTKTFGALLTTSMQELIMKIQMPICTFGLVMVLTLSSLAMAKNSHSSVARTEMTISAMVAIGKASTSTETRTMMIFNQLM